MPDQISDLAPHLWVLLIGAAAALVAAAAAIRVDLAERRLPNRLIGYCGAASWITGAILAFTAGTPARLALAAAIVAGPLAVLWLVMPSAIGGGDVKLAAALAPLTAWPATIHPFVALIAMFLLAVPQAIRARTLAFGPYIVAGIAFTLVANIVLA